jgi:hypothetical protein
MMRPHLEQEESSHGDRLLPSSDDNEDFSKPLAEPELR